jgi:hypothetical protein
MKTTCDENGNVTIIFYSENNDIKNDISKLSDTDRTRLMYLLSALSVDSSRRNEFVDAIYKQDDADNFKSILNYLLNSLYIEKDLLKIKQLLL